MDTFNEIINNKTIMIMNTKMNNDYLAPKCEQMEIILEQCVLSGSVTDDGGSAGDFGENQWGSNY